MAASVVLADEFRLQRTLLGEVPVDAGADETRAALDAVLAVPTHLLTVGEDVGALVAGVPRDRAAVWVAGLNGVLLLDRLSVADPHRFRGAHLARMLSDDLLCGWGATRAEVEVADVHVQRLAALAPLAPPYYHLSPRPAEREGLGRGVLEPVQELA